MAQGGNLPADVAARVGRISGAQAGASGVLGSQSPMTAASLGLTSLDLANQRRQQAAGLLAANPLPASGLDPGAIASASIANANAQNQFDLSRLGAGANLASSQLGFLGAQQAQQQTQASLNQLRPLNASPSIPTSSGGGVTYGLNGLPIGQNPAQGGFLARSLPPRPASPSAYAPGY